METVLRESEQQSLLAVTTTIAGSLKGRQELLFRADSLPARRRSDNARDITPVVLSGAPLIDGRADEWDTERTQRGARRRARAATALRLLAATHERWLYLALLVRDNKVVFDASMMAPLDSDTIGDRIWLAFDDKRGGQQRLFFSGTGAGHACRRAASKRANTAARKPSRNRASRRSGNARATATCWRSAFRCRWSASTSACSSTIATGAARRARATARSTSPICAPPAG